MWQGKTMTCDNQYSDKIVWSFLLGASHKCDSPKSKEDTILSEYWLSCVNEMSHPSRKDDAILSEHWYHRVIVFLWTVTYSCYMFESVFYTVKHNFAKDYRKELGNRNQMVTNNLICENCVSHSLVYFGKRVARMTLLKRAGRANNLVKACGPRGPLCQSAWPRGKLCTSKHLKWVEN